MHGSRPAVESAAPDPPPRSPAVAADWSFETFTLIEWFRSSRARLPRGRFDLCQGSAVLDGEAFYRTLDMDIERGPKGPRAAGPEAALLNLRRIAGAPG